MTFSNCVWRPLAALVAIVSLPSTSAAQGAAAAAQPAGSLQEVNLALAPSVTVTRPSPTEIRVCTSGGSGQGTLTLYPGNSIVPVGSHTCTLNCCHTFTVSNSNGDYVLKLANSGRVFVYFLTPVGSDGAVRNVALAARQEAAIRDDLAVVSPIEVTSKLERGNELVVTVRGKVTPGTPVSGTLYEAGPPALPASGDIAGFEIVRADSDEAVGVAVDPVTGAGEALSGLEGVFASDYWQRITRREGSEKDEGRKFLKFKAAGYDASKEYLVYLEIGASRQVWLKVTKPQR